MEGLLRKTIVAAVVSVVFILIFMTIFGVSIQEVFSVGLPAFLFSASLVFLALIVRGLRFLIIARRFGGRISALRALKIRVASEFIALISFSAVGDEAFRMGWLMREGTGLGKAAWIAYFEIFFDVLVGAVLSLISAAVLLARGAYWIGGAVAAVGAVVLSAHLLFLLYSVKSTLRVPGKLARLAELVLGERGRRVVEKVDETLEGFSETARTVAQRGEKKLVAANIFLTFLAALLLASSLQILLQSSGMSLSLPECLMIVYASIALATIPLTIGGSGLSELGAAFSAQAFTSQNPWSAVIAWRVATYHIPLLLCGVVLVSLILEAGSNRRASAQGKEAS